METSSSLEERPSENEMNGVDHIMILSKQHESSDLDEYEPGAEDEDEEEGEGSNQAEVIGFHNRWSSDGGKRTSFCTCIHQVESVCTLINMYRF
jgi:anti-sigma factor ChrR (cupin superfamily)